MSRFSVAILSLLLLLSILCGDSLGASGNVRVKGYTRKDGTYVAPHYRSAPDGNFGNNWSTKGNVNPYTGKPGTLTTPSGGYSTGTGTTTSLTPTDIFKTTRKAALDGNPAAQNNLGVMYSKGELIPVDVKEAAKWYRKASENGDIYGTYNLGRAYLVGKGVEQDFCLGYNLINSAAERGHASAIESRSRCQAMLNTKLLATLLKFQSISELRSAASAGDSDAACLLGQFYIEGTNGVKKDGKAALKWSSQSADKGNPFAQLNMGWIFANGFGVSTNKHTALQWYTKAAEQNLTEAFVALGTWYDGGTGDLPVDVKEAAKWYRRAAEAGNAEGQANLASCYYNGEGVPKDHAMAVDWFQKAAEQGNAFAQCNLGYMYQMGEGVSKDIAEAIVWYRRAAKQGEAMAQNNLGECYRDGEGVLQNYAEAYKWFNLSAAQGLEEGIKGRKELLPMMTKEQVAEGQKLSEGWTKSEQAALTSLE